ncbi:MAG: C40 family peptidase [Gammaproteobacteria bacterium]
MNARTRISIILVASMAAGCASAPRPPAPPDAKRDAVGSSRLSPESSGEQLVRIATGLIGIPYKFGGDDPRGFDCSGLVFYSYDRMGVEVPRTAADQRRAAERVTRAELTPGDLVFFRNSTRVVDHVGIYAGAGRFIHSPRAGYVVSYAYLDDPYYLEHFAGAGRLR